MATRDELLARVIGQAGWENGVERPSIGGEKVLTVAKNDGSGRRIAISRSRRVYYRDDQGNMQPIDPTWRKPTPTDPLQIWTNKYTMFAGEGDGAGMDFQGRRLFRYHFRTTRFAITPGDGLYFRNRAGDSQLIAASQNVRGRRLTNRRVVRWDDPWGLGINYDLVGDQDQVWKRMSVPGSNVFGTPTVSGPGIYLEVPHTFQLDDDTTIHYRNDSGVWRTWDRTGSFRTEGPIVFRDATTGRFVTALRKAFVKSPTPQIGSNNRKIVGGYLRDRFGDITERISWYDVSLDGSTLRISACFNWDIIRNLTGPYILDPTIDTEAVGDSSDAEQNTYGSDWNTGKNWADVQTFAGGDVRWAANFDLTGIGTGDTINTAYLTVSFGTVNDDLDIRVVEDADHTFPANYSASSTAVGNWASGSVTWTSISGSTQDQQSPSIVSLIESWRDAGGTPGEIGVWMEGTTNSAGNTVAYLIGYPGYQEEIYVEYTVAAAGSDDIERGIMRGAGRGIMRGV